MAVGGFNGTDPAPTLAQFQRYVADGDVHYFVRSHMMGAFGRHTASGSHEAADIADWVETHFVPMPVDGVAIYDLTEAPVDPAP